MFTFVNMMKLTIIYILNIFLSFIAPLGSSFKVDIHDEAYAKVHLGIINKNLDFLVARLCFKGDTSYNLDLFQVFVLR